MAKFNLVDEPWIPVRQAGRLTSVSLVEAFARAEEIEGVEVASPLEEVALHRVLLAILHRALEGPRSLDEAITLFSGGALPKARLKEYLETHYDRFFLFHDTAPFLQVADLTEDKPLPWTRLLPERSSGNNPTLFDHTTDAAPPMASYAEAARALLVHQAFQVGGLLRRLGVPSGRAGPLSTAAAFLVQGTKLSTALALNSPPYDPEGDAATWEIAPLRTEDVEGAKTKWPLSGVARVYTWLSRSVRLLDEGSGIRHMAYGPGVEPLDARFADPMVAYALNRQGNIQPIRLSLERSFWRDFSALLPLGEGQSPPRVLASALEIVWETERATRVPLRVLGQVSDQAKILDVRRETYPFPRVAWDDAEQRYLQIALAIAEEVGSALAQTGMTAARALLDANRPRAKTAPNKGPSSFAKSLPLMPVYWSTLDHAFPVFLDRYEKGSPLAWWKHEVEIAARKAWNTTRAAIGTAARHLKAIQEAERSFGMVLRVVRA